MNVSKSAHFVSQKCITKYTLCDLCSEYKNCNRKAVISTPTSRTWSCLSSYTLDNTRCQIFNLHQYYEQRKVYHFSFYVWALLRITRAWAILSGGIFNGIQEVAGAVTQAGETFSVRAWRSKRLFPLKGLLNLFSTFLACRRQPIPQRV